MSSMYVLLIPIISEGKIALKIHYDNSDLIAQSNASEEETESWLYEIVSCRAELLQTESWGKGNHQFCFSLTR